jgi:predicted acetyltransferase
MADLVAPTSRVRVSFLAAMEEFRAEGRGLAGDNSMVGAEIRDYGPGWAEPALFEEYTRLVRDQAREDAPRPAGFVPSTTLWWVEGEEYLGRIAIRHRLRSTCCTTGATSVTTSGPPRGGAGTLPPCWRGPSRSPPRWTSTRS